MGSRSTTMVDYTTVTETQQTDQSGNQGLNISNAEGVSLSSSTAIDARDQSTTTLNVLDGGALKTAADISEGAFGLAGAGLDNARAANAGALAFGGSALSTIAAANADSLDVLGGLISGAFDNSKTLARDAIAAGAGQVDAAIKGFGQLAKQSSESSDDKVSRVAMYAFAALAVAVVLPAIFKR